ncbi:MAG: hypothetical protein J5867_00870, partial [Prevotella sp.]|nr:hypothetical protein [Prevotella sp.]
MKGGLHYLYVFFIGATALFLSSCSATKFVPDGDYMLSKATVVSDTKNFNASTLQPYIRQTANSKWFSLVKIPLGVYSLAGTDTTKRINRFLQSIGEAPVIYDSIQSIITCKDLTTAMHNRGFLQAYTDVLTRVKDKKIKVDYILHPGEPYYIQEVSRDIQDERICQVLDEKETEQNISLLEEGKQFSVDLLDRERKHITSILTSN